MTKDWEVRRSGAKPVHVVRETQGPVSEGGPVEEGQTEVRDAPNTLVVVEGDLGPPVSTGRSWGGHITRSHRVRSSPSTSSGPRRRKGIPLPLGHVSDRDTPGQGMTRRG